MLFAGGDDALKALQCLSIISGVPFTIFVCLICLSLWRVLCHDQGVTPYGYYKQWKVPLYGGALDIEWCFSLGVAEFPPQNYIVIFLISVFFPPYIYYRIYSKSPTTKDGQ